MGFSRQECRSGVPFLSLGEPPNPGMERVSLASPALQVNSLPLSHQDNLILWLYFWEITLTPLVEQDSSAGKAVRAPGATQPRRAGDPGLEHPASGPWALGFWGALSLVPQRRSWDPASVAHRSDPAVNTLPGSLPLFSDLLPHSLVVFSGIISHINSQHVSQGLLFCLPHANVHLILLF